jgi:hypothetical protein
MDFKVALSLLKAFSACKPRIYRQFAGFPDPGSQEAEGEYVLLLKPLWLRKLVSESLKILQKNIIST